MFSPRQNSRHIYSLQYSQIIFKTWTLLLCGTLVFIMHSPLCLCAYSIDNFRSCYRFLLYIFHYSHDIYTIFSKLIMYVLTYFVCVYVCICVCMLVGMYVCMYIHIMCVSNDYKHACIYVCISINVFLYRVHYYLFKCDFQTSKKKGAKATHRTPHERFKPNPSSYKLSYISISLDRLGNIYHQFK